MPTYVYKCNDCGNKYEVFHKVKEQKENVICPSCSSKESTKMIAAASISGFSKSSEPSMPPCAMGGGCSGGMCPMQ